MSSSTRRIYIYKKPRSTFSKSPSASLLALRVPLIHDGASSRHTARRSSPRATPALRPLSGTLHLLATVHKGFTTFALTLDELAVDSVLTASCTAVLLLVVLLLLLPLLLLLLLLVEDPTVMLADPLL